MHSELCEENFLREKCPISFPKQKSFQKSNQMLCIINGLHYMLLQSYI